MFSNTNFRQRSAEALNAAANKREMVMAFKANPVYIGTDRVAGAMAHMRVAIQMARYWRERNKVVLP